MLLREIICLAKLLKFRHYEPQFCFISDKTGRCSSRRYRVKKTAFCHGDSGVYGARVSRASVENVAKDHVDQR